ncbi:uncharacterized protein CcaverHIS019_0607170 [Cutaneotrichosporon cavernicola]|uniref:Uncharacterized protein n=1 Tax=Cutaneotrichosporon cavernicola TaxID=279322 RepID=A0AA48L9D1_9TREE|nr:uncharacterized protein CcaverHIS019_0607170 [Cutaneotrichosporon cavernicola]BEI94258.1 hypothetical protein CcaverHIS019_0607170 [Cutaneotrichosporon cavernicola]
MSIPHFVTATPPKERWYQRIEERVHAPTVRVFKYTTAVPRGVANHMVTPRVYITSFIWDGGTLSRSKLIEAWTALLDSRTLLQSAIDKLQRILAGRCTYVSAHLGSVLVQVDEAIRIFKHDLACLSKIECSGSGSFPSSWRKYNGPDPVLERALAYGEEMSDGVFRAAVQLLERPIHARIAGALDTARTLADSLAPGQWRNESTPSLTWSRLSPLSPLSLSPSPSLSASWEIARRHEDPAETFRRTWPSRRTLPRRRAWVFEDEGVRGAIAVYSSSGERGSVDSASGKSIQGGALG